MYIIKCNEQQETVVQFCLTGECVGTMKLERRFAQTSNVFGMQMVGDTLILARKEDQLILTYKFL